MKRSTLALCMAAALAACSTSKVSDFGKLDYQSGAKQRTESLEVPPDLTRPGRDERYLLLGESSSATLSEYQSGKGGALFAAGVLPDVEKMSIGRAGNERWLVVPGKPEQVWPRVRQFWLDNGFALAVDKPDVGIMETDWAENRAKLSQDIIRDAVSKVWDGLYSSPERDKFRTRLEPGAVAGTVEVYITHRGLEEVLTGAQKDSSTWAWRQTDPGLESEMLRRLMLALGAQQNRADELLANAVPTERARLERAADGGAALVFGEGFEQGWRQVGQALDRGGFAVEDRDRLLGIYYVRASSLSSVEAQQSKGFLSSLMFWEKEEKTPAQMTLTPGAAYRVFVKGDDKRSLVRVLDAEGNIDKGEEASKLLKLLFDQLK